MSSPAIVAVLFFAMVLTAGVIFEHRKNRKTAVQTGTDATAYQKRKAILLFILGWVISVPSYVVGGAVFLIPHMSKPPFQQLDTLLLMLSLTGLVAGTALFVGGILSKRQSWLNMAAMLVTAPLISALLAVIFAILSP